MFSEFEKKKTTTKNFIILFIDEIKIDSFFSFVFEFARIEIQKLYPKFKEVHGKRTRRVCLKKKEKRENVCFL